MIQTSKLHRDCRKSLAQADMAIGETRADTLLLTITKVCIDDDQMHGLIARLVLRALDLYNSTLEGYYSRVTISSA